MRRLPVTGADVVGAAALAAGLAATGAGVLRQARRRADAAEDGAIDETDAAGALPSALDLPDED